MTDREVVFVCTGNICRSPMAECMLHNSLGPDSGWNVSSAGIAAYNGMPATREAGVVLAKEGIDLSNHASRLLTEQIIEDATVVVAMASVHVAELRIMRSDAMAKVFLMRSFDREATSPDVDDPIGMSVEAYVRVKNELDNAMPGLIAFLKSLK